MRLCRVITQAVTKATLCGPTASHSRSVLPSGARRLSSHKDSPGTSKGANAAAAPRTILPSIAGLEDWREKVRLDSMERVVSSSNKSKAANAATASANHHHSSPETVEVMHLPVAELYRADLHLPSAPTDWKGYEASTPLTLELIALIGVTGRPLSTADYMRLALTHADHGYYTNATSVTGYHRSRHVHAHAQESATQQPYDDFDRDEYDTESSNSNETDTIIGADFVTAPELSNVFGECLGFWFAAVWHDQLSSSTASTGTGTTRRRGGTEPWQWLECGPGKGTLMVDLMRLTLQLSNDETHDGPLFGDGCRHVHLIEQSPAFRHHQRQALMEANLPVQFLFDALPTVSSSQDQSKRVISVHWHDSFGAFQFWQTQHVDQLLPTFIVGQEFLDALPVYTFEKTNMGHWRERLVDVALRDDLDDGADHMDPTTQSMEPPRSMAVALERHPHKPRLRMVLAPDATPPLTTLLGTDAHGVLPHDTAQPVGSVVEVCPDAVLLVQDVATLIDAQGGAALFVDYGSPQGSRDSLRGFSRHEQVHFLSRPGHVDITADVDFLALSHAVNHRGTRAINDTTPPSSAAAPTTTRTGLARAFGPVTQGEFLVAMGIRERIVSLMVQDDCTEEMADNLYQALHRLASPEEMGERYKVLGICAIGKDAVEDRPPGF